MKQRPIGLYENALLCHCGIYTCVIRRVTKQTGLVRGIKILIHSLSPNFIDFVDSELKILLS